MWAEATSLISVADTNQNVEFLSSVIDNNNTVPVILTDESDSIISARNFDAEKMKDPRYLNKALNKIKEQNNPIVINLENNHFNLIYYKDSTILTMLIYYPYIQLGIIILFILVSYLAFSSSQKSRTKPGVGRNVEGNRTSAWNPNLLACRMDRGFAAQTP